MSQQSPVGLEPVVRWGTHSAKWDLLAAPLGPDALSLSVADMEFRTAPAVIEAVTRAARHGSYGYTEVFEDFRQAAVTWQDKRHGWRPRTGDVHFFPRIVQCVSALCCHVLPADLGRPPAVVTLVPAYGPVLEVVGRSGAELRRVPLLMVDGVARLDLDALGRALDGADLLLWCHPHNPSGRVWSRAELADVGRLARERGVLILSDDVHADFTRPGRASYVPLAQVCPELWHAGRLIQCTSPGKTFTTAGLEASAIMVRGDLGERLEEVKRLVGLHNPGYFAVPAALAAWERGGPWVDHLLGVLDANLTLAVGLLRERLPRALVTDPEGTYLVWVDARAYLPAGPRAGAALESACRAARVAVSPGQDFGREYVGWFRVNAALPATDLRTALERLCDALLALPGAGGAA